MGILKTKKISVNKGVSVMELLVVIAILGVLLAVVLPEFSKSRERATLDSAVGNILAGISQARGKTLASVDSSSYGMHFSADEVIIFKGENFFPGDPENDPISITQPAAVSDVTLDGESGASGEFYFNRLSGSPSVWGTVTVSTPSYIKTITITATGSVSAN
jgi:prepilin-type N-terminal cleavage/methylation domain-containing protein